MFQQGITFTEIKERVTPILAKVHSISPDTMGLDNEKTELIKDLGFDSLDIVELTVDLEKEFDIHIDEDDFVGVETIGELYEMIFSKIKDK